MLVRMVDCLPGERCLAPPPPAKLPRHTRHHQNIVNVSNTFDYCTKSTQATGTWLRENGALMTRLADSIDTYRGFGHVATQKDVLLGLLVGDFHVLFGSHFCGFLLVSFFCAHTYDESEVVLIRIRSSGWLYFTNYPTTRRRDESSYQ